MARERLMSTRGAGWVSIGSAAGLVVFVAAFTLAAIGDGLDEDGSSAIADMGGVVAIVGLTAALAMLVRGLGRLDDARSEREADLVGVLVSAASLAAEHAGEQRDGPATLAGATSGEIALDRDLPVVSVQALLDEALRRGLLERAPGGGVIVTQDGLQCTRRVEKP